MQEIEKYNDLIFTYKARLEPLQKRLAIEGIRCDPSVPFEIEFIKKEIKHLNIMIHLMQSGKYKDELMQLPIEDIMNMVEVMTRYELKEQIDMYEKHLAREKQKRRTKIVVPTVITVYISGLILTVVLAVYFLLFGQGLPERLMLLASAVFAFYLISLSRSIINLIKSSMSP